MRMLLAALAATLSGTALAQSIAVRVDIDAGPLPQCLQALERQTGMELLFDHAVVRELQSPAVQGTFAPDEALRQMLGETSLTLRRAESGAWILERPAAPPLAQPDAAVPEILVVGQRTQNADIRRFENDVQPYTVATQAEILASHRDSIDEYFVSRVTPNTTAIPPSLQQSGGTLSSIDLRGLGPEQTLVLVDGRRMPSVSNSYYGFLQSDLNAIPLHAVERIETLTGTASGIYGFGALGGVVNVVLDRNTSGLDLHFINGISSRGDARRQAVEAKFGHSFGDGATDLVLFASHSDSETAHAGERDFTTRDRRRTYELDPDSYMLYFRSGRSVRVENIPHFDPATGETRHFNLELKPEFGGATLASDHTFLPGGFSGDAQALGAALSQHAGQTDFSLTKNDARADLGSNPVSDALFVNLRHRFGENLEAFADAVVLRNRGESKGDRDHRFPASVYAQIAPESPANPFTTNISVEFPVEGLEQDDWTRVESARYTAGLLAELPGGWRGTAEMSWGSFSNEVSRTNQIPGDSVLLLFGDPSDPDVNPLGDWGSLQRAMSVNPGTLSRRYRTRTSFEDYSMRLGGPVFSTAAGPATLSLLAERRNEDLPAYEEQTFQEFDGEASSGTFPVPSRSVLTTSLYAELRTRLFDMDAPAAMLRGLELQLAVRRDDEKDDFAADALSEDSYFIHSKFIGTTYTAGAKVSPAPWLMLRGSYATGEQPPVLNYLAESEGELWDLPITTDPQRGNTYIGADGPYLIKAAGDADMKAVRATTMSLGVVLTPSGSDGARVAIDFSRIRRTRDLFQPDFAGILDHEDYWPERVERAPLTDDDRAKGYTAGRVTMFDWGWTNGTTLEVDTVDLHADWPLAMFGGRLRLYADATRSLHNVKKAPFQPDVNRVDYREGPLKWRANGGFDWSKAFLTIGANAQFYDGSLVYKPEGEVYSNEILIGYQGSRRLASQWYLDLYGSWRIPIRGAGPLADVSVDIGIVNVFDTAPPRESFLLDLGPGYSRYGDPRQRRFDLVLSAHF